MESANLRVPFGERDGVLYPPDAVPRGLACNCTCPGCGARLIARQGPTRRANFAHYKRVQTRHCVETAVHRMAKQVLLAARDLVLPAWTRAIEVPDLVGIRHRETLMRPARTWLYSHAREEVHLPGARPDVVLTGADPRHGELLVEIRVTHAVDEAKTALVRARGWAMVEIDLSAAVAGEVDSADFADQVLRQLKNRSWIHSPHAEAEWLGVVARLEREVEQINAAILSTRALAAVRKRPHARAEAATTGIDALAYREALISRLEEMGGRASICPICEALSDAREAVCPNCGTGLRRTRVYSQRA